MNNTYVRAIRGPVMLITLGALGVLYHEGSYSITKTWPVLLIVMGLMRLLERAFSGSAGEGGQTS
jgi:hypothetical protein